MFTKTLSRSAQNSLAILGKSGLLKDGYLAGGSALALHLGHRYSLDFDFFTPRSFDAKQLTLKLGKLGNFKKETIKSDTIVGEFNKVKFSFFYFPYPLVKKLGRFLNLQLADPADIGAMKIAAIVDRGTKRDFIDLYFLIKEKYQIEEILKFYNKKYQKLSENIYSIIKSLKYFEDAEESEMPRMIKKISWEEIKRFFESEAVRLGKKYL
ncbi:MAG: nucleotidyl transferase AbiEii/AbiGii toxin family protein [Patescibacteria group bacterium]